MQVQGSKGREVLRTSRLRGRLKLEERSGERADAATKRSRGVGVGWGGV